MMTAERSNYKTPLIIALLFHGVLLFFLLTQLNLSARLPNTSQSDTQIIHATVIDGTQMAQQQAKIQAQQQAAALAKQQAQQAAIAKQKAAQQAAQLAQQKAAQAALAKQQAAQAAALAQQKAAQLAQQKQQQLQAQQQAAALAQQKAQQAAQAAQQQAQQKQQQLQAQQQAQQKQQQLAQLRQQDAQDLLQQQLSSDTQQLNAARAQYMASIIDKYRALIINAIAQEWLLPDNTNPNLSATLLIHLAPGGVVLSVQVTQSSGNSALDRSAVAAVYKASPLPVPADPAEFNSFRDLSLVVKPESFVNG